MSIDLSKKHHSIKDRTPVVEWLTQQPVGATTKQVMQQFNWASPTTTQQILGKLRDAGLICQHGRQTLARWCVPATLAAVKEIHDRTKAAMAERETYRQHGKNERKRLARIEAHTGPTEWPRPPRWVFDLATAAVPSPCPQEDQNQA